MEMRWSHLINAWLKPYPDFMIWGLCLPWLFHLPLVKMYADVGWYDRYRFVQRGIRASALQPHWCALRPGQCDLSWNSKQEMFVCLLNFPFFWLLVSDLEEIVWLVVGLLFKGEYPREEKMGILVIYIYQEIQSPLCGGWGKTCLWHCMLIWHWHWVLLCRTATVPIGVSFHHWDLILDLKQSK